MDQADGPKRSIDEIRQFIETLSDANSLRLLSWARAYAYGSGIDLDELVHEALVAALLGDRKCPAELPIMVFLKSTIRSLASGELGSVWHRRRDSLSEENELGQPRFEPMASSDPRRDAMAKDGLDRVLDACSGDETLQTVLLCKGAGYSPEETQKEAKLTPVEYASALRQIRRTVDHIYPEGWE